MLIINENNESLQYVLDYVMNEAQLAGKNSDNFKKYALNVINIMLNGGELAVHKNKETQVFKCNKLPNKIINGLKILRKQLNNGDQCSIDDFNLIVKPLGIKWTNIEKTYSVKGTDKDLLGNKELSPQTLGIYGEFNKDELIESVKHSIKHSGDISDELKSVLFKMLDGVNKCNDELSIDDLSNKLESSSINLHFDKINETIEKSTVAIKKDFCEILSAIYLLKSLKNANHVIFNEFKNEPMIDYTIKLNDGALIPISVKSNVKGHKPSAEYLLNSIKGFINSNEKLNGETLDEMLENHNIENIDEIKNIFTSISKFANESTKEGWIDLINETCGDHEFVKSFCKLFGFKSFSDLKSFGTTKQNPESEFENLFDSVCENKFKELKLLSADISKGNEHKWKIKFDTKENSKNYNTIQKLGFFMYAFEQLAVKYVNDKYGGDPDVISMILNKALNYKQIYSDVKIENNEIEISFAFDSMDRGKWMFHGNGSGTNPFIGKIAVTMK